MCIRCGNDYNKCAKRYFLFHIRWLSHWLFQIANQKKFLFRFLTSKKTNNSVSVLCALLTSEIRFACLTNIGWNFYLSLGLRERERDRERKSVENTTRCVSFIFSTIGIVGIVFTMNENRLLHSKNNNNNSGSWQQQQQKNGLTMRARP